MIGRFKLLGFKAVHHTRSYSNKWAISFVDGEA